MEGPGLRRSSATLPTTHQRFAEDGLLSIQLNEKDDSEMQDDSPLAVSPSWGSPNRRGRSRSQESLDRSVSIGGLHHRRVTRTESMDQVDEHERGYAGQSNQSNTFLQRYQAKRRHKHYPYGRRLRTCMLAGIPAYLVLIFLFLKRMNHKHALDREQSGPAYRKQQVFANSKGSSYVRELHTATQAELKSRIRRDEQEWDEASSTKERARELASLRRKRSRPPRAKAIEFPPMTILSPTVVERPDSLNLPNKALRQGLTRPSNLDEICGFQAQNAAIKNPGAFTYRDSLIMPKSRVTRVLITGIMSQPAYLLALALKERCKVEIIIGFDALYPNSIRNRLRLQEQMALLTKYIPKLVRPIFLSHLGLDPPKHSKNFKVLEQTQELDLWRTLNPTHIIHLASYDPSVFRFSDPDRKNVQSPYVRTGDQSYDPALFGLRSGMLTMEQILAALAAAPKDDRPHFIYASASPGNPSFNSRHHSGDQIMHTRARQIDEVLADFYYQEHGVYSVGMRLPNSIYGPWGHPESDLYQLFDWTTRGVTSIDVTNNSTIDSEFALGMSNLDLLHVNDLVDGVIAAMQYRPENGKPTLFDLSSGGTVSLRQIHDATKKILDKYSTAVNISPRVSAESDNESKLKALKQSLGWAPRVPLKEGVVRAIAWHLDRIHPYGPPLRPVSNTTRPQTETGDMVLKRHSIPTCAPDDVVCHGGRPFLPCASECSARDQCIPTSFDEIVPMVQELTEECDIVLYTHNFDKGATDLALESEFMENGHPLVCNFAFISSASGLVDNVIEKVPNSELGKLGFELTAKDAIQPGGIKARKNSKLNGRLLYRGWILIWVKDTPEVLTTHEKYLLKLSPGRLFHSDVKAAVFIDQGFGVSPKADDIKFLVREMHRKPWNPRVVKRKSRPKAKFLLPAEPQRRAVILMSELKYQDSSGAVRLSPDEKITTYEATRFMRFSNGEEPLGNEPAAIKLQREYYDRLRGTINPDLARSPEEPLHRFELKHWVRSRWVAHDMSHDASRQLRCKWYQEHVLWETDLDQLSFAYVMEKLELDRKLEHNEPDEVIQKQLTEKIEMKKLLSDTFEWHALKTKQNKVYSPYEEMQVLPYDMDSIEERELAGPVLEEQLEGPDTPFFVRIISDRIMAYARKSWNNPNAAHDEL